jgi:hypothetical protein
MFTQGVHAESSSAQNFHPEFGYFCPTPRLRRNFRSAVITVVAGIVIVAGAALALSPQLAPPSEAARQLAIPQIESQAAMPQAAVPLAVPLNDSPMPPAGGPAGLAQETVPTPRVSTAPATRQLAAAGARSACDDLSSSFLAPRCRLGKAGKSRMAHTAPAAGARTPAISTGGADAGPQPTTAVAAGPAVTANEPEVAQPAERAVPAKKPVKTTHKPMSGRELATAGAAPPAPATGFGLLSLLRAPTRTGGGAWAMSW